MLSANMHKLLTNDAINALRSRNINSVRQFVDQDVVLLSEIMKLPFHIVLGIRRQIINKNASVVQYASKSYQQVLKSTAIISTFNQRLDEVLDGGFYTGRVYEICSKSHTLIKKFVYTLLIRNLGMSTNCDTQRIIFYDTVYGFNALEFKNINEKLLGNNEDVMDQVLIEHTADCRALISSLNYLKEQFAGRLIKSRLVVIDSIVPITYASYSIEKSNMLLTELVNTIRLISVEYHVTFIITNSVKEDSGEIYGSSYWKNVSDVKLLLTPGENIAIGQTFHIGKISNSGKVRSRTYSVTL